MANNFSLPGMLQADHSGKHLESLSWQELHMLLSSRVAQLADTESRAPIYRVESILRIIEVLNVMSSAGRGPGGKFIDDPAYAASLIKIRVLPREQPPTEAEVTIIKRGARRILRDDELDELDELVPEPAVQTSAIQNCICPTDAVCVCGRDIVDTINGGILNGSDYCRLHFCNSKPLPHCPVHGIPF